MATAGDTIQCLSTKEIKALARPEFEANPEKFYPTTVFESIGFSRSRCACGNFYWRHTEARTNCGDSNCEGKYTFIGNGTGKGKQITFAEAWKGFETSFTSARIPCKAIKRYPIVARWRNDVDYVAAGIFCFQPYCVTGELDPPANPLICPQFCARFNDLDNIGLTGRHYSGFIMMGIQVFNTPDEYHFFKDECIEFNYRWLTETLGIDPDDITFVEDVWAGGGNLGPSVEYFVRGLEVGNMVFMQYKTYPDGSREELDVKVIDVGIGLERIAWLNNGSATSYSDTFKNAMDYFMEKTGVEINEDVWKKYGPYSCTLNIDEVDNIEETWQELATKIDVPVDELKASIQVVKEMFIILDHTRTILITISDGSLPSNVGGGGNVRNILRRSFAVMKQRGWWELIGGMDGFIEIFEMHKRDLFGIYGEFPEYKSFRLIIEVEYERWLSTDEAQTVQLKKLIQKKKNKLSIDDWILAMTSWGIPLDTIAQLAGVPAPGNLYYEIACRQEKVMKAPEKILYNTIHLKETENLYFEDGKMMDFSASVIEVYANQLEENKRNLVILDRSSFYPTSGGQMHDIGTMTIEGIGKVNVVDCIKVGKCVLHKIDMELAADVDIVGKTVQGSVDPVRRFQLQAHHTGTHIIFAACRQVLGPHIWQAGAKKSERKAHIDITHFQSLTRAQEQEIENTANRMINDGHNISKGFMEKAEAERQHGFSLYQGGVVPGNSLRVVEIEGIDVEACCGTHADNTSEVGWLRLLKTSRISDGIVRMEYVAQERAIEVLNLEADILSDLCEAWGVNQEQIKDTALRFFHDSKRLKGENEKQEKQILELQVKSVLRDGTNHNFMVKSEQESPTLYVTYLPQFAEQFKEQSKGIVFVGTNFVVGLFGDPTKIQLPILEEQCAAMSSKPIKKNIRDKVSFKFKEKGKKPINATGVCSFMITGAGFDIGRIVEILENQQVISLE